MGQIMIETNPDYAYQYFDLFNRELAKLGGSHCLKCLMVCQRKDVIQNLWHILGFLYSFLCIILST